MHAHFSFPDKSTYLERQRLLIFELQLCPIDHKTCSGFCNLVIIMLDDTSTHLTLIFWGKVCHRILK